MCNSLLSLYIVPASLGEFTLPPVSFFTPVIVFDYLPVFCATGCPCAVFPCAGFTRLSEGLVLL